MPAATYTFSGAAIYDNSGAFQYTDDNLSIVAEDPASNAVNGVLEIGEKTLINGGAYSDVFVGMAIVDGQSVIVLQSGSATQVYTPTGILASSLTWPATFGEITLKPVASFTFGVTTLPSDHTTGGLAVYDANGDFANTDGSYILSEDPDTGAVNGFLEVGEDVLTGGFDYGETYLGTATVDGHTVIVLQSSFYKFVFAPTGVLEGDVNWPAKFDDITLHPILSFAMCFSRGTNILTPQGERPVERLEIGDLIVTANGLEIPVKWIGRQTVHTRFTPAERLMPVRFAAGSLGNGLPHGDLTVTADHGMLVDGVICHAGALVNGTTITRVPLSEMGPSFTVYHIETENHEIILANGAPAETFIDNVSRRVFDNFDEFEALYGDVPEMEELDYPRAMSARQVPPAIKRMLGITKVA